MTEPKRYLLFVLALVAGLSISACGGGGSVKSSITPPPVPADFTVTVQPNSVSVTQGSASSPVSIAVSPLNNFSGSVAIAISGLPSGVTASSATLQVAAGSTQSVTFSAATSANLGPVVLNFVATSGSLSHSASAIMSVIAAPDFGLAVTPGQLSVTQGASSSAASVSVTPLNSFSGKVTVDIKGLPAGIATSAALPLQLDAGAKQQLTFSAASSVAPGTMNIVFQGVSGSLTHSATAALQVQAAAIPDFSLSIDQGSLNLQQGTSQAASLSVAPINHFGDNVAVSISGLPNGVTVAPASPLTVAAGSTTPITFTAAKSAPVGTAVVTFAGVDGALSHSTTAGVQVLAAATDTPTSTVSVAYFDYDGAVARPDSFIRIVNPGTTSTSSKLGDLCANIYVFDSFQELAECCSCPVTANGFSRLSLFNNLTDNQNSPNNFATFAGSVFVVPSTFSATTLCDATSTFTPVPNGLNVWGTRPAISARRMVETLAPSTPLSGPELTLLQSTCGFIVRNDSGAGICTCPPPS